MSAGIHKTGDRKGCSEENYVNNENHSNFSLIFKYFPSLVITQLCFDSRAEWTFGELM